MAPSQHTFKASIQPDKPDRSMNEANIQENDEISVLDLLATLAENAKLLFVGPVLITLLTYGGAHLVPQKYSSQAILAMPNQGNQGSFTPAQTSALLSSPLVLDPILQAG